MKEIVNTAAAPAAIGPYSQAVIAGEFVYVSGQIPLDPATGEFVAGGVAAQTEQVFKNLKAILAAAESDLNAVVKTTVFLADMQDFAAMNEIYTKHFVAPYPARATVQAAGLPRAALVEIEVIARREAK